VKEPAKNEWVRREKNTRKGGVANGVRLNQLHLSVGNRATGRYMKSPKIFNAKRRVSTDYQKSRTLLQGAASKF
jgi:hypothetical protein